MLEKEPAERKFDGDQEPIKFVSSLFKKFERRSVCKGANKLVYRRLDKCLNINGMVCGIVK